MRAPAVRLPRTVVHVVTSFGVGGTERQLVELLRGLDRSRWRPRMICFRKTGGFLADVQRLGIDPTELGQAPFALAVSGFIGWENSGALAEESKDPKRYIPITVFSSIAIITGLYVLSSWAAVAGFADWKGPVTGVNFLGSFAEATPFLDLSRHFSHWFDWFIALVGFTSSFGCFIAAANSQTRITFNGARAGLLPPPVAAVSRTKVPWASVFIYTGLLVILVVVPYFALHGNAVAIFSDEAGFGTVPILIVYLLANISLPLYVLATNRAAFRPVKHVLIPLIGSAVLVYGVYEFVQPSQPPPANWYWAWILAIVLIAVIATAGVYLRKPEALERAGTVGPEFVQEDLQGSRQ